jgi:hypothetical protein
MNRKLEGNKPSGRPRCRWENVKMDISEIGYVIWAGMT